MFVRTPGWDDFAEPAAKDAIGELVDVLGSRCTTIETPTFAGAVDAQRIVQSVENAHYYSPLMEAQPDGLTEGLKARLVEGGQINGRSYLDALAVREAAYDIVADLCTDYSAILTLSAPGPAPAGYGNTGNPVFNGLWTFMGVPCVSLPLLEIDGLPLGVQLVGMRNDDGRLLRTAQWLETFVASAA